MSRPSFLLLKNLNKSYSSLSVNNTTDLALREIAETFEAPIRYCVAYGSGVFPQSNTLPDRDMPMVDFIFGVTHAQHWHSLNLRQNPHHYSFMKYFGCRAIEIMQDKFAAKIYYNTNVIVNGRAIKYGVISMDDLLSDLEDWETLYCAGRMHKPVKIVQNDARAQIAQQKNLEGALSTALLLLPERFSQRDLYLKITGLSYTGDFRMKVFGENPRKIQNIVDAHVANFDELYAPFIAKTPFLQQLNPNELIQDVSPKAKATMVKSLPKRFKEKLLRRHVIQRGKITDPADQATVAQDLVESPEFATEVKKTLKETIMRVSISQSLKGILTAGPSTSFKYAQRKLSKGLSK